VKHSKPDFLSRPPSLKKGAENDNENTVLLKPELFISSISKKPQKQCSRTAMNSIHEIKPMSFIDRIKKRSANQDESVKKMIEKRDEKWKEEEKGLWIFGERIYVPSDRKLRGDVIQEHHDTPLSGHYGQYKTAEAVLRHYWWPTVKKDVTAYVTGCETCQRTKPHRTPRKTPLHPFDPPSRPWEVISTDIIGPLPESQGYDAILVIVDCFTKAVKFEPIHMELTSQGFAKIFRDRVIRDHGLPKKIIHDRDTRFVSKYLSELFSLLGVKQNTSTAYHPQTDGQTEWMNQSVEQYLHSFINH
jgi:transposase InsO family protein